MAKRIFLFLALNMVIMLTVTTVLSVLGIGRYITPYGLDYSSLAAFCLVWGMVGAFISLQLSRWTAKRMLGVELVDPNSPGNAGDLVRMVHGLARAARLPVMPEVGIYQSPEVNAFATGPSKSRALVAVSSGILSRMNRDELEAVLGHEITHIANGDMVTMALLQGVVNAFVMFFARVLAFALSQALEGKNDNRRRNSSPMMTFMFTIVFEILFNILGMMIIAFFSRRREYRADAGGAKLAGQQKMINALQALQRNIGGVDNTNTSLATLKIAGGRPRFTALFATHPPLEERIARLQSQG